MGPGDGERALLDAAATGVPFDLGSVRFDDEIPWFARDDLAESERTRRSIRAEILGDLLRGKRGPVHWRGVELRGANVVGPLELQDAEIRFSVSLRECLVEDVRLERAIVGGFQLFRCRVRHIQARGLTARFGFWLAGSACDRGIDFSEANIGENLELEYTTLGCPPDKRAALQIAFSGEHLRVGGMIRLVGATVMGAVHLPYANVGSRVDLGKAVITPPQLSGMYAVNAPGLHAEGEVSLNGATVKGGVNLKRARIGSSLELRQTTIVPPLVDPSLSRPPVVLACDGAMIRGNVVLESSILGALVAFPSATIEGSFICGVSKAVGNGWMLYAARMRVADQLLWDPQTAPLAVDLMHARLGSLDDKKLEAWPLERDLFLDGLTYDHIATGLDAKARLQWLRRQREFSLQPYEQLIKVYRVQGHEADARRIGWAKQRDRRPTLPWPSWVWNVLTGLTLGHGYQPWRAAVLLATMYVACGLLFWHAQARDAMVPTRLEPSVRATQCTSSYPCFSPWAYAFDISIPLLSLGQADSWRPDASALHGNIYRRAAWGATVLGWTFATLLIASLTGLIRKD